jgi:hypothetical protein
MAEKKVFDELFALDLTDKVEGKSTGQKNKDGSDVILNYLSWSYAWAEVKKRYPNIQYEIKKFDGLPYVYDEKTGYMVYTSVTIDGITHEMWLPVMDSANKAMKAEPYKYTTGYGQYQKEKTCAAATMFDVNKTIMRCLVKNLAMFGLGLYIYAGEDLPSDMDDEPKEDKKPKKSAEKPVDKSNEKSDAQKNAEMIAEAKSNPDLLPDPNRTPEYRAKRVREEIKRVGRDEKKLLENAKVEKWEDLTDARFVTLMAFLDKELKKKQK